ncbi:tRNA (N6-isopentenyl adenosine(37)-C2)-methylthiotransferase MiaB, partial [candidate division KSB1 bacterium]|nr:tRNA (N6-isopentenyl adenosine(37)-C2)-methylthiotransferase MiaB [candidate division KSB1 bacterium]
ELVASILESEGYKQAEQIDDSDLILINTCSVRDHAEARVKNKLDSYNALKKHNGDVVIGVLGCMAQRLGFHLIDEKGIVDFVVGPDGYRKLPEILSNIRNHKEFDQTPDINNYETYSDIYPSRVAGISAWVAVMRGCNNFCAYCIVPYVRGRERSRSMENVLAEVRQLIADGYSEVTLLGQNVNSYHDGNNDFADLLRQVSRIEGIQRVRFATSHPKDLSPKLLQTIGENERICNHIHLAVQSGSNKILEKMNRKYTREHFLSLIKMSREFIEDPGIYTDVIVGFPGETEQDFNDTMNLIEQVKFDGAFTFKYSPRSGTAAARLEETVSEEEKQDRLTRLIRMQQEITLNNNRQLIGSIQQILIEGPDKKEQPNHFMGRTGTNKIVVFRSEENTLAGSMSDVKITNAEGQTLFGELKHTK